MSPTETRRVLLAVSSKGLGDYAIHCSHLDSGSVSLVVCMTDSRAFGVVGEPLGDRFGFNFERVGSERHCMIETYQHD